MRKATRGHGWNVIGALLVLAMPVAAEETAAGVLGGLLPEAEDMARYRVLVAQLSDERFQVREAATRELEQVPLLPREVVREGLESGEPETMERLQRVLADDGAAKARAAFERALKLIVERAETGLLPKVVKVLEQGVRPQEGNILERAAARTTLEGDVELVRTLATSEEVLLRRVAAAAGESLGDVGRAVGEALLEDEDAAVRMRAAITMGHLGDVRGVRALVPGLAHPDGASRMRVFRALRGMTGQDFGFDPFEVDAKRAEAMRKWEEWTAGPEVRIVGRAESVDWVELFNGRDLSGWTPFRMGKALDPEKSGWQIQNGKLMCPGKGPGDLRTNSTFRNYLLLVRFFAPVRGADSGIGVMLLPQREKAVGVRGDGGDYLEVQLLPNRSGDLYVIGDFEAQAGGARIAFSHPRHADVGDDAGQWHEALLEVRNGSVKVSINGTLVNEAEGGPKEPGKILLREEGGAYQFEKVLLLPLEG